MATVAEMLKSAASRLALALGLEPREARLEAQILAARALGVDRAWLIAHDRDVPTARQAHTLEALWSRRERGEPVAYILGEKEFYGRVFNVTPDVLIPRPETELLVDAVRELMPTDIPAHVLDLGTGSGCIAITLAASRPGLRVTAVDLSAAALDIARTNAATHGVAIDWHISDMFDALSSQYFDMIVSNPPYIAAGDEHLRRGDLCFEPARALSAGADGLDLIRRLVKESPDFLLPDGWLIFEHGWDQGREILELMTRRGFHGVRQLKDLQGHPRVTAGRRPPSVPCTRPLG